MAYTLTNLQDDIRNYTEVDSSVLSTAILNTIIKNAENRIYRQVDSDDNSKVLLNVKYKNKIFNLYGDKHSRYEPGSIVVDNSLDSVISTFEKIVNHLQTLDDNNELFNQIK